MKIDIGIAENDRAQIAEGLSHLLADSYTLYLMTHGFHWNVTGPMFQTLHDMFMQQYTELWQSLDLMAERIRALGHYAPASGKAYGRMSSIPEPDGVPSATDMLRHLLAGHETCIRTARRTVPITEKAGDQASLDLLTQRLQVHEKTAWMLRSLLE